MLLCAGDWASAAVDSHHISTKITSQAATRDRNLRTRPSRAKRTLKNKTK
ncbi:hypothetical protein C4K34_4155 [Pseudomonas chlororaphis subsp. piscium]|nr:hypothetical protein C4K34_4155 [Pseudomonas chlororaphis subsp. piscium]